MGGDEWVHVFYIARRLVRELVGHDSIDSIAMLTTGFCRQQGSTDNKSPAVDKILPLSLFDSRGHS